MSTPTYARTRTMYGVFHWDKHDRLEVVCGTEPLAQQYIDGQWSDEYYSIKPVMVIEELPERRPLYILSGRVPYPDGEPTKQLDDFAAQGEFPGLGNGAMVKLDETTADLSPHRGGWSIKVVSWDREDADAEFAGLVDAALRSRAALVEAFAPYPPKTVVSSPHGVLIRSKDQFGTPWWADMETSKGVYDYDIDPAEFTVLREGDGHDTPQEER